MIPKSTLSAPYSCLQNGQSSYRSELPITGVPGQGSTRWHCAVLFQLSYCKQAPFRHLFSHLVLFLLEILLFKVSPSIAVHKEMVVWLIEKMCVGWASFRHEFQCCWPGVQCQWINNNINVFKQKHRENKVTCFSSEEPFKYRSWQHSPSVYRTDFHK